MRKKIAVRKLVRSINIGQATRKTIKARLSTVPLRPSKRNAWIAALAIGEKSKRVLPRGVFCLPIGLDIDQSHKTPKLIKNRSLSGGVTHLTPFGG